MTGRHAALSAIMVLVTVDVLLGGPLRHLDRIVHELADTHVRDGTLAFVHAATKLGQRGILVPVIALLAVLAAIQGRSLRYPVLSAAIVVALSVLEAGLKAVVPRTFPFTGTDVLWTDGTAYPSGHTLNAFVLDWVVLELLVAALPVTRRVLPPRRRRDLALITGTATAVALTVADEHWLTDVLFSLALGPLLLAGLIAAAPFSREVNVRIPGRNWRNSRT